MVFTKLNMALFAPMPSASVSTATAVKPGFFSSWRKANFRSFIPQRHHRIDLARAPGREPAGEQDHHKQQRRSQSECERVKARHLIEEPTRNTAKPHGQQEAQAQAQCR